MKSEFAQISTFPCIAKGCKKETSYSWYNDGWFITGLCDQIPVGVKDFKPRDSFANTEIAMTLLESAGLIKRNGLAATVVCPDHKQKMIDHVKPFEQHWGTFKRGETDYRQTKTAILGRISEDS